MDKSLRMGMSQKKRDAQAKLGTLKMLRQVIKRISKKEVIVDYGELTVGPSYLEFSSGCDTQVRAVHGSAEFVINIRVRR